MIRFPRGLCWVALSGSVVLALTAAHAQETSGGAPAARVAPAPLAPDAAPPFWIAGVVIGPERRSAILVPLDAARRELGILTLHEGQSYGDYWLVTVEPAGVLLEANGTVVSLGVGRPYSGPRGAPDAGGGAAPGPIFIPGPDRPKPDLEYTGRQVPRGSASPAWTGERPTEAEHVRDFVERLFSAPQVQQQIEEIRPLIRQKMERGPVPPTSP